MNRDTANRIRYLMDEWIPAFIRNSKWFMYPFYLWAYRGKNIKQVMDFKRHVHSFTPEEYAHFYNNLDTSSRNRKTDLNKGCLQFILAHIDPTAETLIDVGSGNGHLLETIHKRHPQIRLTGLDLLDNHQSDTYAYVKGNLEALPFPDKSFDVVTCSHVIEHLLSLETCIAELIRITRKQLFIVTPCQRYFYYTLDEHIHFFPTKENLIEILPLKKYTCQKLNGDWAYCADLSDIIA